MPIATPEKYAEMLDAAKSQGFAFPAINVSSSQTLNAALQGFAEAGSDGIVQVSTGGADYLSGPDDQEHGHRLGRLRGVRRRGRQGLPGQHRAAHRPLPQGQARRLRPAAHRHLRRAGRARGGAAVPVAHVGRVRRTSRREPPDRRGAAGQVRRRAHHPRDRGRRGRRRGGRRRGRDRRQAVLDARGRDRHGAGARYGRQRAVPHRAHVRQRARRLQAGQRQAAPGGPQGGAGGSRQGARPLRRRTARSTWSSTAAPARQPTRSARPWTSAWSR